MALIAGKTPNLSNSDNLLTKIFALSGMVTKLLIYWCRLQESHVAHNAREIKGVRRNEKNNTIGETNKFFWLGDSGSVHGAMPFRSAGRIGSQLHELGEPLPLGHREALHLRIDSLGNVRIDINYDLLLLKLLLSHARITASARGSGLFSSLIYEVGFGIPGWADV